MARIRVYERSPNPPTHTHTHTHAHTLLLSNRDLRAFQQDTHQHASQVCSGGRQEAHHRLPQLDVRGSARQQRERHHHRGEGAGAALRRAVQQFVAAQRSGASPARDGNPYLKPALLLPHGFFAVWVAGVTPQWPGRRRFVLHWRDFSGSGSVSCDYTASACGQQLVLELAAQVEAAARWCSTAFSRATFFYLWTCSPHNVQPLRLFCAGYQ